MSVKTVREGAVKISNPAVMMLLIACYCAIALARNNAWQDEYNLSRDSIVKSPYKGRPYLHLGLYYFRNDFIDDAIKEYLISIRLAPGYDYARNNLGVAYYKKGLVDMAIAEFQNAITLNPNYAEAHYNLGVAYGSKGLASEAYEEMRKGMKLSKSLTDELKK